MNFIYPYSELPNNPALLEHINDAAARLYTKISCLDVNALDISKYNKRYLAKHQTRLQRSIQKYAYLLLWGIANQWDKENDLVFVDYGGGVGLLSLLAKEAQVGPVIYNDIYDISCSDAATIAESLGLKCDYYVTGDIKELHTFLNDTSLKCNAIASYDVIEHIYDIEAYLQALPSIADNRFTAVMASGANSLNPLINWMLSKNHKKIDLDDRQIDEAHKERDSLQAYHIIRKKIIQAQAPQLSADDVDLLAARTRGLIEADILMQVDHFMHDGTLPPEPSHPTNTCDPYTGNWAEHLMDPHQLTDILSASGLNTRVMRGYCGSDKNLVRQLIFKVVDLIIRGSGPNGLRFSPYYIIYATNLHSVSF